MKIDAFYKQLGMSLAVLGLAVGCGGEPVKEEIIEEPQVEETTNVDNEAKSAAENAIFDAKQAVGEAQTSGVAIWNTTEKLIKNAEKALAAGDFEKAKMLADEAKAQIEKATNQAREEENKFIPAESFNGSEDAGKAGMGVTSYSVVKGDSLWGIAGMEDVYGNPYQWPLIYKANASIIKDPDLIFPGQVFDINQNPLSEEVEAAISHAKSRGAWSVGAIEESDKQYLK